MLDMHTHTHSHTHSLPTPNPCRGQVSVNCFPCSRWMDHSVRERRQGGVRNTHTHTNDINTHACIQSMHTHTHIHSLARMPANRDCYQLISARSCRGQPYWHCNDSFPGLSGTVSRPTVSFWFNYKYTQVGIKLTSSPRRKTLLSNAAITCRPYGLLRANWPASSKWLTG